MFRLKHDFTGSTVTSPSKDSKTLLFGDKPVTIFGIRYSPVPSPAYFVHGLSLFVQALALSLWANVWIASILQEPWLDPVGWGWCQLCQGIHLCLHWQGQGCCASEGIIFLHGPLFVSECVCCFTCLGIMFSQIPNPFCCKMTTWCLSLSHREDCWWTLSQGLERWQGYQL